MEECYEIAHETKARGDSLNVSESLRPIYDRLKEIRTELERLSFTRRWTLKETDLYNYTVALAEIDRMRKDGRWGELEEKDKDGEKKPKAAGQYVGGNAGSIFCSAADPVSQVLLYVLRRCYGLIYKLLSSSEPVSEELMPIVSDLFRGLSFVPNFPMKWPQANKLSTVKKCLNEVLKYGGPYDPRELYPVCRRVGIAPLCMS